MPCNGTLENEGRGRLALAQLLAFDESIPPDIRRAIHEHRRADAAQALMARFGLSCAEASELLVG